MAAFDVPAGQGELFFVRLKLRLATGEEATNLYTFSTAAGEAYAPALTLDGSVIVAEPLTGWESSAADPHERERAYRVRNEGTGIALHVHPQETTDGFRTAADYAYFSLFPGEEQTVRVRCRPRSGEVFAAPGSQKSGGAAAEPAVAFHAFDSTL